MSRIKPIGTPIAVAQRPLVRVCRRVAVVVLIGLLAPLVTSGSAFAAPFPVHPLNSQCAGVRFDAKPDDAAQAKKLMAGKLQLPAFRVVRLSAHPTWHEDPFHNKSWTYQYHDLRWLDVLRREAVRTHDKPMRDRYLALVQSWITKNPYGKRRTESPMAWYNMSVGLRATELACAAQLAAGTTWLKRAMREHGSVLADRSTYVVIGNHALHQNIGLLALGCYTRKAAWKGTALNRIARLARRSIDSKGVTDEGSSLYEYLNYVWYSEAIKKIKLCGIKPPTSLTRVSRMPAMLAQETAPNGDLIGLGDSNPLGSPTPIRGTEHQYAATQGASGPRPAKTFMVYDRGYLFSRKTWDPNAAQSSYLTLRFGQSRDDQVHGQDDATDVTFYALGKEQLWGNGVHGDPGHPPRKYVVSTRAQNIVDIVGASYIRSVRTPLLWASNTAGYDAASVSNRTLSGATTVRTVIHAKQGGFLVVDDRVTQSASRKIIQRWQLGEDRKTRVGSQRVTTSGPGSNATLMWVATAVHLRVVKGQQSPYLLGWRSDRSEQFTPSPVVEASVNGKHVRITMVLVPRSASTAASLIKIVRVRTSPYVRQFDVVTETGTYRVHITTHSASVVKL